jgi:hypothetical protein
VVRGVRLAFDNSDLPIDLVRDIRAGFGKGRIRRRLADRHRLAGGLDHG